MPSPLPARAAGLILAAALGAAPAIAQPIINGNVNDAQYTTIGTRLNMNDGFGGAPNVRSIRTYLDVSGQRLFIAVEGNISTSGNADGIGLFLDVSTFDGADAGTFLGGTGGHYLGSNNSLRADFEVDYAFALNAGPSTSEVFVDAVRYTPSASQTVTADYLGASNQSGTATTGATPGSDGVFFGSGTATFAFNNSGPVGNGNGFEIAIPFSALNILVSPQVSPVTIRAFAFVVSNTAFYSDETVPGNVTGGNPGGNGDFFTRSGGPYNALAQSVAFNPSSALGDGAGWRLLSTPIDDYRLADLATLDLVQGVPAGGGFPAQHEAFPDNVYVRIVNNDDGAGSFEVPSNTAYMFDSGQGFFWYRYDNNATSPATGTSRSFELTGRLLAAPATQATPSPTSTFTRPFPAYTPTTGTSRFYLVGNPFARPLAAGGITSSPARGANLQVWDPSAVNGAGSYVTVLDATYLTAWQGAVAEVASAASPTFSFNYAQTDPNTRPPFYGRSVPEGELAFQLDGALTNGGAPVGDVAAVVRFDTEATADWDLLDASKLTPPSAPYALVSPILMRDGEPYRAAVSAVPAAATTVPLSFLTTGAGTFTLTWTGALPAGFEGTLRDVVTGEVVALSAGTHAFDAEAEGWTERFELVVRGTAVAGETSPAVAGLRVGSVLPNPTSGRSAIRVDAPLGERVTVRVYDALGRVVVTAFEGAVLAGGQDVALGTDGLAPGLYIVRVEGASASEARRLTVLR